MKGATHLPAYGPHIHSSHEASAAIRLTMAGTMYRFNLRLPFFEACK